MRPVLILSISVAVLFQCVAWAQQSVPTPLLLLESWQQLDADFQETVRSYKLQVAVQHEPGFLRIARSGTSRCRVWRDGKLFQWVYDLETGERFAYSFDGVKYYCYIGPNKTGLVNRPGKNPDLPSCENAFSLAYPFELPHFWRSPLAGGHWRTMEPYYGSYLRFPELLKADTADGKDRYVLRVVENGQDRLKLQPQAVVFQLERNRFIPIRFTMRDDDTGNEVVLEITAWTWYRDVWIPNGYRVELATTRGGSRQVALRETATLKVTSINEPIPPERFRYAFPLGTEVMDEERVYMVKPAIPWTLIWVGLVVAVISAAGIWLLRRRRGTVQG